MESVFNCKYCALKLRTCCPQSVTGFLVITRLQDYLVYQTADIQGRLYLDFHYYFPFSHASSFFKPVAPLWWQLSYLPLIVSVCGRA